MQVNAYVIYDGTGHQFVGDQNQTIQITCEQLNAYSPRRVWLLRQLAPGDGTIIVYTPTFFPTSAEVLDTNTLQGWWIEVGGKDAMIDMASATGLQDACDACCGTVPTVITRYYTSGVPSFTQPTISSYCIQRLDDGTTQAVGKIALDYLGQIVGGAVVRSRVTSNTHYTVQSYYSLTQLKPVGADIITSGACSS